jgi:hypothetical protein
MYVANEGKLVAKLTLFILQEPADGQLKVHLRECRGFKRDRRNMEWWVVFSRRNRWYRGHRDLLDEPPRGLVACGPARAGGQSPTRQTGPWAQDESLRCATAGDLCPGSIVAWRLRANCEFSSPVPDLSADAQAHRGARREEEPVAQYPYRRRSSPRRNGQRHYHSAKCYPYMPRRLAL